MMRPFKSAIIVSSLILHSAIASAQIGSNSGTTVVPSLTGGSNNWSQSQYFSKVCFGTQATPTGGIDVNGGLLRFTTDCNTTLIGLSAASLSVTTPVSVANGGTGLNTLTAHALYVGNGTSAPSAVAVCGTGTYIRGATGADPICSTLTLPNTASAGQVLIATTSNTVIGVAPALNQAEPADQTARSSSGGTFVHVGLGAAASACTITPVATGRVIFIISGDMVNNTTATTFSIRMAFGTGTAPANNAAATGTVISRTVVDTAVTNALTSPFSVTAIRTGLALNTAVWFDMQLTTSGANTGQLTNVDCTAWEL